MLHFHRKLHITCAWDRMRYLNEPSLSKKTKLFRRVHCRYLRRPQAKGEKAARTKMRGWFPYQTPAAGGSANPMFQVQNNNNKESINNMRYKWDLCIIIEDPRGFVTHNNKKRRTRSRIPRDLHPGNESATSEYSKAYVQKP